MKLTLFCFVIISITILLICDQNGVEAKKKKHGKGGDKYEVKNNNYKANKDQNRKPRESRKQSNIKEGKNNEKKTSKSNKLKNEFSENNKDSIKNKNEKKKDYTTKKNVKNEQTNKDKTKEVKNEKYSKEAKENVKLDNDEGLNGRSYDIREEGKETLIVKEPEVIIEGKDETALKTKNGDENIIEETKIIEVPKPIEKANCDKCDRTKVNQEKLLQCNKKKDSVERNTTEICEKYKLEKNTQVFEEKITSDKHEAATNILDTKQPKCEL